MNPFDFPRLVELCMQTHAATQRRAVQAADLSLVVRNWLIGWFIVEYEQHGADRARYGSATLPRLSAELQKSMKRGFSVDSLELMRRFFSTFRDVVLADRNSATPSRISLPDISETLSRNLEQPPRAASSEHAAESDLVALLILGKTGFQRTLSAKSSDLRTESIRENVQRAFGMLSACFPLGWSHYVTLLTIDKPEERRFYEIEASEGNWSVRELERQIASSLYERLALSGDKKKIRRLAEKGQVVEKPVDLIKNPMILEFLGLQEQPSFSETELESAIISRLQTFLLELGKGFLFEARQKRFTFDNDHFFVDLVFYNRLLRCYVLIDLKRDKLTHQDLGQMQMYVNYFDRYVKTRDELPTVGIVLCHRKNDALVELTLPKDANVFASKYQLYLPSKDELKARLEQIEAELGGPR